MRRFKCPSTLCLVDACDWNSSLAIGKYTDVRYSKSRMRFLGPTLLLIGNNLLSHVNMKHAQNIYTHIFAISNLFWQEFLTCSQIGTNRKKLNDRRTYIINTVQLRTVVRTQGLIPRLSKLDPQSRLSAPKFQFFFFAYLSIF